MLRIGVVEKTVRFVRCFLWNVSWQKRNTTRFVRFPSSTPTYRFVGIISWGFRERNCQFQETKITWKTAVAVR